MPRFVNYFKDHAKKTNIHQIHWIIFAVSLISLDIFILPKAIQKRYEKDSSFWLLQRREVVNKGSKCYSTLT